MSIGVAERRTMRDSASGYDEVSGREQRRWVFGVPGVAVVFPRHVLIGRDHRGDFRTSRPDVYRGGPIAHYRAVARFTFHAKHR